MINWSAYAPRRARDPEAWLRAKSVSSMEDLRERLLELGIEPDSFPQDVISAYLGSLCATPDPEASSNMPEAVPEEIPAPSEAPAQAKRASKRGQASTPT